MDIQDAPCALHEQCPGVHATPWELIRGEDFPSAMATTSLQTAMHAKARHANLGVHTRKHQTNLQVQFFRSTSA